MKLTWIQLKLAHAQVGILILKVIYGGWPSLPILSVFFLACYKSAETMFEKYELL